MSSKMPQTPDKRRGDKRRTDTKERLFKISLKLFAEKGFESTSIRDIVGKAGISTAAFYNHFESKDALLHAVYAFYMENKTETPDMDTSGLGRLIDEYGPVETVVRIAEGFRVSMEDPILSKLTRIVYMERQRNPVAAEIVHAESAKFVSFMETLFMEFKRRGFLKKRNARLRGRIAAAVFHSCIEENIYARYLKGVGVEEIVRRQSETLREALGELIGG